MNREEMIASGLLELYAMGALEGAEFTLVEAAVSNDPAIAQELEKIEEALWTLAKANEIRPNPTVKPFLMAQIDYLERLEKGEVPDRVPVLTENSKVEHFEKWLTREDMQLRPNFREAQVTIISDEPDKTTSILWLKSGSPPETHTSEHEKFLIIEGTCDLTIGTETHHLEHGDYLTIPLHISHYVIVTSPNPCKAILQRVKI